MQRIAYLDEVNEWPEGRIVVVSMATRSRGSVAAALSAALKDPGVHGILFSIDSPGGTVIGMSEAVAVRWWPQRRFGRALHRARRKWGLPV